MIAVIFHRCSFLHAVRNRDMSWPEEMSSLANNRSLREKLNLGRSKQPMGYFVCNIYIAQVLSSALEALRYMDSDCSEKLAWKVNLHSFSLRNNYSFSP